MSLRVEKILPPTITDLEIPSFCIMNPDVTHLSIKGCKKITDASLPIIESLGYLKYINIASSGMSYEAADKTFRNRDVEIVFIDSPPEKSRQCVVYDI